MMGSMTETTLAERIRRTGMTINARSKGRTIDADGWGHDEWSVTLAWGGRRMTIPFRMGTGHQGNAPQLRDVLEALLSDAAGYENEPTFGDWALAYGYDPDSRKAEKLWRDVGKQTAKLRTFLGDHYEAFLWETRGD